MDEGTLCAVGQKRLRSLQAPFVVGFALLGSRDGSLGHVDSLTFMIARRLPEQLVDRRRHVVRRGGVNAHHLLLRVGLVSRTYPEARDALGIDADQV